MASLYKKPVLRTDPKSGEKVKGKSAKWWGRYRDARGTEKRVPLAKDKSAAQSMLNELVRKVELEKAGRLDPFDEHAKRPLTDHVDEFEASLRNKEVTSRHAQEVAAKIRRIVSDCGFTRLRDLSASRVQQSLADLRSTGLSAQTSNHYLRAIKQFSRWLVRDRRLGDDPLAHLSMMNVKLDRRHERRALSSDELAYLIRAAESGRSIEKISGPDRAMMYVLAVWTGYRKGEIGSLTRCSLKLDADPPVAVVQAAYSKRRREDEQVLHPSVVERLREWLAEKSPSNNDLLFPVSGKVPGGKERKTCKMMRRDLEAARKLWLAEAVDEEDRRDREASDFLLYCDHNGRYADFHSNRHTFITSLSRNAVSPKTAQTLARHSDIRLTMGLYTHIELHDQQAAIESLPAVPDRDEQQCQLRATGTDDASASPEMVPILVPSGAENGAKQLAANPSQSSSDCIDSSADAAQKQKEPVDVSSRQALELCSDADDSEPVCTAAERPNLKVHPRGVSLAKQNRSESIGCYFRGPAGGPATNSAS